MCFTIFWNNSKNVFLGFIDKKFKKRKNWHFSKGVNPWFVSKNGHFFNFFFSGSIGNQNVFYDILERKKFKQVQKDEKIDTFSKRLTYGFVSKMVIFSTFFFRQYRPGKCLFRYSRTKKIFLGYENNKLKNLKNWFFSKGVNPWFWSKKGYFSLFLGNISQENVFTIF